MHKKHYTHITYSHLPVCFTADTKKRRVMAYNRATPYHWFTADMLAQIIDKSFVQSLSDAQNDLVLTEPTMPNVVYIGGFQWSME